MTWDMYDAIVEACDLADASAGARAHHTGFRRRLLGRHRHRAVRRRPRPAPTGVAYERRIGAVIDRLERLTDADDRRRSTARPSAAAARIAVACDLRLCADTAALRRARWPARSATVCRWTTWRGSSTSSAPARVADLMMTGRLVRPTRPWLGAWHRGWCRPPSSTPTARRAGAEPGNSRRQHHHRHQGRCCAGCARIAGRPAGAVRRSHRRLLRQRASSARASLRSPKSVRRASCNGDCPRYICGRCTPCQLGRICRDSECLGDSPRYI